MTLQDRTGHIAVLETLRRLQAEQLALLDAQAKNLRDQMVATDTSLAVLRMMAGGDDDFTLSAGSPGEPGKEARLDAAARPSAASRQRSPARRMMIEALEAAGTRGIGAGELNDVVTGTGMKKDTAEKSKAALKKEGLVGHDRRALRWYAAGFGPSDVEADRLKRAGAFAREAAS